MEARLYKKLMGEGGGVINSVYEILRDFSQWPKLPLYNTYVYIIKIIMFIMALQSLPSYKY